MRWCVPTLCLMLMPACGFGDPMTLPEAAEALEQARTSASHEQLTNDPIEVSTDFTIGQALVDAAQELGAFWQSQVPCTEVSWDGAVATIDYGDRDDGCLYRGKTYGGIHTIAVQSTDATDLEVWHDWSGFTDGAITVDGGLQVQWQADDETRTVGTDLAWTQDGLTTGVTGDHVYGLLEPSAGVLGGVTLEGVRRWTNDRGTWDLDMAEVQVRWQDPAPQAGTYTLTNPDGKVLVLTFTRLDDDTIRAELSGARIPLAFDLTTWGAVPVE